MMDRRMTYQEWADLLPNTVFGMDTHGNITYANDEACKTFGYTRDDLHRGIRVLDMFIPEDHARIRECFERILNGEKLGAIELTALHRDNTRFPVLAQGIASIGDRRPMDLTVIMMITTTHKETLESKTHPEEKFRLTFESVADCIAIADLDTNIIDMNTRGLEIFGAATKEEVIGKRGYDFIAKRDRERAANEIQIALGGLTEPRQYNLIRLDGTEFTAEVNANVFRDASGNPIELVVVIRDVTEKYQAEQMLRESELKFRTIFEEASDEIIVLDENGTILDINRRTEEIWGHKRAEVIGKNFVDFGFILPDKIDQISDMFRDAMEHHENLIKTDFCGYREDGKTIYTELNGRIIEIRGQKAAIVVARDITERRQIEEALRESEDKLNQVFRLNPNLISITSVKDGRLVDVNDAYLHISGWTREEIIGKTPRELGLLKNMEDAEAIEQALVQKGEIQNLELAAQDKYGNDLFGLYSAGIINVHGEPYVLAVINNITERKQALEALKAREERFRSIIENADDAITLIDSYGKIMYASPSLERIAGYKPEELIGVSFQAYMHPDDFVAVGANMDTIASVPGGAESITMRLRHKDGSWRWVEGVGKNFLEDPNVGAIVCNYRDVTERIQAEEAMRESEEKWLALADNSPGYILSIARDGTIQFLSRPLPGYKLEDVVGSNSYSYLPDEGKQSAREFIEGIFETGQWCTTEANFPIPTGNRVWYEITAVPIMRNDRVDEVIYIAIDITDRKLSEEQLQQYAMELEHANSELAEYSQVVVHDIGTPLRAIRYHTRILRGLGRNTSVKDWNNYLNTIDAALSECEELAQNLLGLSQIGRSELNIEPVDIGNLVQRVITSSGLSEEVAIETDEKWLYVVSESGTNRPLN